MTMGAIRVVFLSVFVATVVASGLQHTRGEVGDLLNILKRFYAKTTISEEAITTYEDILSDKTYRWAIFKLTKRGHMILTVDTLDTGAQSFSEFLDNLYQSGEPRYALYDVPKEWGVPGDSLVFLYWSPDGANFQLRLRYQSMFDEVKKTFHNVVANIEIRGRQEEIDMKEELLKAAAY